MRGHGGPSRPELQRRLAQASPHQGNWPKISIWQGTADNTVVPINAESLVDQWQGVHGVAIGPTRKETVDGQTRHVWCDAGGNELIEKYTIAGMGHGTPVKTTGKDNLGNTAPFMLDVGISSTRHIAAFWDLTDREARRQANAETAPPAIATGRALRTYRVSEMTRQAHVEPAEGPRAEATGISNVIEDAFRAAGLMR
jgi:hypothetical protein